MGLPYVGPAPTDPADIVHKGYVDTAISTTKNTYTATSTTSNSVATGAKTFALTGVGGTPNFVVGQILRAYNTGTPANYVQGLVTAASTSSVTINATETGGSGTLTAWTVSIAGATGAAGSAGGNGTSYTHTATSVTSNTVGTGSKTFAITGVGGTASYAIGESVRITSTAATTTWMLGLVTAASATSITVNVTDISGSGTIASWSVTPSGPAGTQIYVLAPGDPDPTSSSPVGFYFRRTS